MSTKPDFDSIAAAWLAEGPTELADRVLDAALDEAHRTRQRHPIGVPWRARSMSTPFRFAAAAITVVAVALLAVNFPGTAGVGGPAAPSSPPPTASPTTEPTATQSPTPSAAAKAPAATIDELVDRLYAALHSKDTAALQALAVDGARHAVYSTDGLTGSVITTFENASFNVATDPLQDVARQGDPIVVTDRPEGRDLVAMPLTFTYQDEIDTGFDVFFVERVPGGLLFGETATFYGKPGLTIDPDAVAIIDAQRAAWNAGDVDAVLATMSSDAAFWEGLADPNRNAYSGEALRAFIETTSTIKTTFSGTPLISGTFVAAATTLSNGSRGISLYEIRDGKIALHVYP